MVAHRGATRHDHQIGRFEEVGCELLQRGQLITARCPPDDQAADFRHHGRHPETDALGNRAGPVSRGAGRSEFVAGADYRHARPNRHRHAGDI